MVVPLGTKHVRRDIIMGTEWMVLFFAWAVKHGIWVSHKHSMPTQNFLKVASIPVHLKIKLQGHQRTFRRCNWKSFLKWTGTEVNIDKTRCWMYINCGTALQLMFDSCFILCHRCTSPHHFVDSHVYYIVSDCLCKSVKVPNTLIHPDPSIVVTTECTFVAEL